jgi:hypothetical protein
MKAFGSLHKGNALFLIIALGALVAFAGDILDVRDEVHLLSCPYNSLDNNITTGLQSHFSFNFQLIPAFFSLPGEPLVVISPVNPLSFNFRAPPAWS